MVSTTAALRERPLRNTAALMKSSALFFGLLLALVAGLRWALRPRPAPQAVAGHARQVANRSFIPAPRPFRVSQFGNQGKATPAFAMAALNASSCVAKGKLRRKASSR